ncbi:MAG: hypothetical protein ACI837_001123 [Crocinitomicaceae bacterium]|jgi:hypothetical protein
MKTVFIPALILIILCCSIQKETVPKTQLVLDVLYIPPITINVEIEAIMPIGWGTKYRCKIISISSELLPEIDSTFTFSVSVGNKTFNPALGKATLTFARTGQMAEHSYIPSGTTGMINKYGEVWNLLSCLDFYSGRIISGSHELSEIVIPPLNQFTTDVYIHTILPISWGSKFRCNVLSFKDNTAPAIDSTFVFYGQELNDGFPLIDIGEVRITFDRLIRKPDLPVIQQNSRMIDNNGDEWYVSDIEQL